MGGEGRFSVRCISTSENNHKVHKSTNYQKRCIGIKTTHVVDKVVIRVLKYKITRHYNPPPPVNQYVKAIVKVYLQIALEINK